MANIFIVEDELIILERIMILLEELDHTIAGHCDNADLALEQIKKSDADVILLDIALPGKNNGISLARQINKEINLPIIFTSSFQDKETISEAAETNPVTYLTKPINKGDLLVAIELALKKNIDENITGQEEASNKVFYTKIGDKLNKIQIESILWLKASDSNYCDIVVSDGKPLTVRSSLQKLMKQLPQDVIIQVHRQFAININAIDHINLKEQSIYIKEEAIPLGRTYKNEFMKRIDRL